MVWRAGLRWVGSRVGKAGRAALMPCRPRFWVRGGRLGGRECGAHRGAGSRYGLGHPVCRWIGAVGRVVSSLPAVPTNHSYCGGVSSLRCVASRVVAEWCSPVVFQGSIHPSSGLSAALATASGVLIAVVGAPAVAAVVPPSVLPISKRSPGVPPASGVSVAWAILSVSGVIWVPVAVPPASIASIAEISATVSSPSVVTVAVPPGSSVVSAAESSV